MFRLEYLGLQEGEEELWQMAGLKRSNPHLSKFSGIFLGILLGLGWQNLPQSNFFPFWSVWKHLQLGAQSQKHLLHTYFPYLIETSSAHATWGPFQGGRWGQSSGSSTFSPSQPKLVVTGWLLENLLEDFLPWFWSSCYKTHCNSSAEKQLPLTPLCRASALPGNPAGKPASPACSEHCFLPHFSVSLFWKPSLIYCPITWTM